MHIHKESKEYIPLHSSKKQSHDSLNSSYFSSQDELSEEIFDKLQSECLIVLKDIYQKYKSSAQYFRLYNSLNLEVKQYIILMRAGMIPPLEQ
jgi:hypothetical protein